MKDKSAIEQLLHQQVMLDAGLVPITTANGDVNRLLASQTPEETAAFKRKFRKVWRTLFRSLPTAQNEHVKRRYGVGEKNPTPAQRRERKQLVLSYFNSKVTAEFKRLQDANT